MEKTETRAVIKYFLKGLFSTDIKTYYQRDTTLGRSAPSFTIIKTWVADFKRGRISSLDAERSGKPKSLTTDEIVRKANKNIMNDNRLKLAEVSESVGNKKRTYDNLISILGTRKLSARWVPRLLILNQKPQRTTIS
ncbi:hypothetical protein HNY73_011905 [Argiope bruennichi]|uniref:Transposase n=1 Tax=Argiope bruennichi TaxID=94029 RepID=A0A8T0EVA2_ARGBR|nr:hypothetical protein HNY73_011905 [Argiope bruennichi]